MSDILNIEVQGQEQVERVLLALKNDLSLVKILDEATAALFARNRARYLQAVNPDGVPWKESHAAQLRKARGQGGLTLFDTGRLFHSLQLYSEGDSSRAIGTDVPYGKFHQYGKMGWVFLGFSETGPDSDVQLAEDITLMRVAQALEGK